MSKVIGICNLHDDPHLGLLTQKRPCGAVTFLGRYGLVDFTLSNFSNSHIDKVLVLVKNGMVAMRNHIGNGSIWTNNTKTGFIRLVVNEEGLFSPKFNTDIANLKLNLSSFDVDFDYAVVAPSFMVSAIDYRPVIKEHIASGADVTIVYSHMSDTDEDFINCDRLKIGENNKILKIDTNIGRTPEADISLESFVISRRLLLKIFEDAPKISEMYNLRNMITYYIAEGKIDARAYQYEGYVAPILSFENYVKHSFNLLSHHAREKLFQEEWPIYTTTHNTPPTLYGPEAKVKNSFIANGSIIKGRVENSIISREVVIREGAKVRNCIIFTKSDIGKDVSLHFVVSDKGARIDTVKYLSGDDNKPLYVSQGAKI